MWLAGLEMESHPMRFAEVADHIEKIDEILGE